MLFEWCIRGTCVALLLYCVSTKFSCSSMQKYLILACASSSQPPFAETFGLADEPSDSKARLNLFELSVGDPHSVDPIRFERLTSDGWQIDGPAAGVDLLVNDADGRIHIIYLILLSFTFPPSKVPCSYCILLQRTILSHDACPSFPRMKFTLADGHGPLHQLIPRKIRSH